MRVAGGRLKGREVRAPRGLRTRPTAAKVKEAIFALLGGVEGASVLDLFAGSGGLGIEALSRGAARALFVEADRRAAAVLADNLRRLGLSEEARLWRLDAAAALRKAERLGWKYDLVLIDPPYAEGGRWQWPLARLVPAVLQAGGRAVVESDPRAPLALADRPAVERRYGDTLIRIYAKEDMEEMAARLAQRGGEG